MSRFKKSGFKTSGLQNVRFTKRQVYKTSGLQNVRFTKRQVYKTSCFKRLVSKRPVFKFYIFIKQKG